VPGPTVARSSGGARIGTYWSGSDRLNGYTAHARGYIMYLGMAVQPPAGSRRGSPVYADANGRPLYPTIGAPRTNIQVALNWEASGHEPQGWAEFWYASVMRFEPTAGRDLQMAVTLDVGRDGVPVVVELDTHGLPNWQAGSKTPHIRPPVTIVGYDNAATPPTYTYIDTCGRSCKLSRRQPERPAPRHRPIPDGRRDAGHPSARARLVGRRARHLPPRGARAGLRSRGGAMDARVAWGAICSPQPLPAYHFVRLTERRERTLANSCGIRSPRR